MKSLHIGRGLGLDEVAGEYVAESLCLVTVATTHREVGKTFQGHLLSMGGTTDTGEVLVGHIIHLMEILRADQVLIRHDTLDGREDKLVADARLEFLQMTFQIG